MHKRQAKGDKMKSVEEDSLTTTMSLSLPIRALLLKLFYHNGGKAAKVLRLYRGQKRLRKSRVTPGALRRIVKNFEKTSSFAV